MTLSSNAVETPRRGRASAGKRLMDVIVSTVGLVFLAPIMAIVALAVAVEDGGPAIFRQVRLGRNGRPFQIVKFRSMKISQDLGSPSITVAGDQRITRVGAVIRRFKIDELPQLWNVIRGDMSLVGPRPETPSLAQQYTPAQLRSLTALKPGITDWASLVLRSESELLVTAVDPSSYYSQVLLPIKYELWETYRSEASVVTDLRIIAATLWAVLAPQAKNPFMSGVVAAQLEKARRLADHFGRADCHMKKAGNNLVVNTSRFTQRRAALASILQNRFTGRFARKFATLSVLTGVGQVVFVAALPAISRMYTPSEFGIFAIYLSIVNLAGPLMSLKFDSALYASATREEASQTLKLALITLTATSCAMFALQWIFHGAIESLAGGSVSAIVYLLPIGMLLAGAWSVSSAWAVRAEASSTLGVARFLQPVLMTILQLIAGLIAPTGTLLVVAHMISHIVYSSFIAVRELKRSDVDVMRAMSFAEVYALGRKNGKFPMFALPAQLSSLSVSNLPPILLSYFYGAGIAGHYGLAYRIVIAPLTVASLPLGAIFMGSLVHSRTAAERAPLIRKVFLVNLALVGAPVLILGMSATTLAPVLLGPSWVLTGKIIAALSFLGAAQGLAAPFAETTSLFRGQTLRLLIEGATVSVVVSVLVVGGISAADPLHSIWAMSVGGAAFSLAGLLYIIAWIDRPTRTQSGIRKPTPETAS